jgi:hypothetical protein
MKLNSLSFACGGRRLVSLSKGKSQNISIFIVVLDMMGMEGEDMMGMEGGHSWYKGGSDEDRGRTQWVQGKDMMGMEGGHMGTGREREQRKRMGISNVNDIETKRSEASIMGIFAKSKRNEPVE